MIKKFLLACMAALAVSAQAAPISFFDVQLDISTVAQGDAPPVIDSQASPPLTAPLQTPAALSSSGTVDVAIVGAFADTGLLSTTADISAVGFASAVATSHFSGWFLNDGPIILDFDLLASDTATGGFSQTSLFVKLVNDGMTVFDGLVTGPLQLSYIPTLGTRSFLDVLLVSEANGTGNAQGFGQATFSGVVPLPATLSLALLGLGALVTVRKTTARRGELVG